MAGSGRQPAQSTTAHREHQPLYTSSSGSRRWRHAQLPLRRHSRAQHLAAILAALGAMCGGSVLGWTAPALPHLMRLTDNSTVEEDVMLHYWFDPWHAVSAEEACWIVSSVALGGVAGSLAAGCLFDCLGRKALLLAVSWPYTLGWIVLIFSRGQVLLLCLSRFVSGVAMGAYLVVTPIYSEEIAEMQIRGQVGMYMHLMLVAGVLWSYVLGAVLSYLLLAVTCLALPIVYAALVSFVPESPLHHIVCGQPEEAEKALRWLHGSTTLHDPQIQHEMFHMQKMVHGYVCSSLVSPDRGLDTVAVGYLQSNSFRSPSGRTVVVICGLVVFQQLTFWCVLASYLTLELTRLEVNSSPPVVSTVMMGIVQLVASLASLTLVDGYGRRKLLLTSAACVAACAGMLALHVGSPRAHSAGWLPLLCIALYSVGHCLGLGPLPWLLMAELVPTNHKALISSLVVCLSWALVFCATNAYVSLGPAAVYGAISLASCVAIVFVYLLVPETMGRTREEIYNELLCS